jgi:hypothetical protein
MWQLDFNRRPSVSARLKTEGMTSNVRKQRDPAAPVELEEREKRLAEWGRAIRRPISKADCCYDANIRRRYWCFGRDIA